MKSLKQFVLYGIVGGLATVVEWLTFYLFSEKLEIQYLIATVLAFIISTFANWLFGRLILFKGNEKGVIRELVQIYLTSIIGLLLNLIIMYCTVELLHLNTMLAKVIATGIVFFWNFLIRKYAIYKI